MINTRNLSLNKEENPEFYSILEKHNALMGKWNQINRQLVGMKVPKIFLWNNKAKLKEIYKAIEELQKEFLEWNRITYQFILNPIFTMPSHPDNDLIFLHNTANLRDIRNKMSDNLLLILNNYNHVKEWRSNQLNFIIAITSFVLTFVGLIVALLTFIPNSDNTTKTSEGILELKAHKTSSVDSSGTKQKDSTKMYQTNKSKKLTK